MQTTHHARHWCAQNHHLAASNGEIARHGGPTRQRHAARRLRVVQTPHHHRSGEHLRGRRAKLRRPRALAGYCHSPATGTRTTPEHDIICPTPTAPHPSGTKLSTHTPSHRISGTKLSLLARNGPIRHVLPIQGEFCTAFTTKNPSRENFVPLSPPRTQAGRTLYRFGHQEPKQGEFCTEHEAGIELANTTAHQAPPV